MPDPTPRILSLLSHELRGPLGVIRGYLRMLIQNRDSELSAQSRHVIEAALRASDRIADVLDEASLLSHLRNGDIAVEFAPVALATLVQAAITSATLPEHARVEMAPGLPEVTVEIDPTRMRLAFATLITAVARAHTTAPVVEIGATRGHIGQREAVRLRIGPRTLTDVEVTEVDADLNRGGLGLGLPLAAFIVERHGGQIRDLRHGDRAAGVLLSLPIV